jgi:hypothetical protein
MMPSGGPAGQFTNFIVENTSDQERKVISVEVVNDVGSAFNLSSTNCLNFVLTPRGADVCIASVEDKVQAESDVGRLVVVMDDNTVKTASLPFVARGRSQASQTSTLTPTPMPTAP